MHSMSSNCGHRQQKMKISDMAHLRTVIQRDVFDYQQLIECLSHLKKPRDKIRILLRRGDIIRIRKGLYTFGEAYRRSPLSRELLANLIYGPSYISLDYALSYHNLIPERVAVVTSVTVGRSRTYRTFFGDFSYRTLTIFRYATGALLESLDGSSFLIASPEKALIDKVWSDKRFSGTSLTDFGAYLEDDLRIEREQLNTLDFDRLEAINKAYNSQKIGTLLRHLHSLREARYA